MFEDTESLNFSARIAWLIEWLGIYIMAISLKGCPFCITVITQNASTLIISFSEPNVTTCATWKLKGEGTAQN